MTTDTEHPLISLAGAALHGRRRMAVHWSIGMLVVLVGVLAVVRDSWPARVLASWINVPALFGSLLWILVIVRFRVGMKHMAKIRATDLRDLSRQLSRTVYLVLYLIIGAKQVINIVAFLLHGGALAPLFDTPDCASHDCPAFEPVVDSQLILIYGLIALIMIRVLAFWIWLRLAEDAASRTAG
jgi:cytochrome b561